MFCDLVGSTALSARLDPEDMRQVIAAYHTRIREVVGQYHGVVARYMGDGALVYFGYPHAHEDDAEQATRAGLALVDAMPNLQKNVDVALQVRIGIATGRSEEHTSELQSQSNLVCRLLLEKKKHRVRRIVSFPGGSKSRRHPWKGSASKRCGSWSRRRIITRLPSVSWKKHTASAPQYTSSW